MVRLLFLAHRYLGIAVGLVVTLWCLSGFVMMYVPYPELPRADRVAWLRPLDLGDCCTLPNHFGNIAVDRFGVEIARREVLGRGLCAGDQKEGTR